MGVCVWVGVGGWVGGCVDAIMWDDIHVVEVVVCGWGDYDCVLITLHVIGFLHHA